MIRLAPVTPETWPEQRTPVLLLESVFPPRIRASEAQIDSELPSTRNISVVAYDGPKLVGYGLAEPLQSRRDFPDPAGPALRLRTLYLSSCSVDLHYRHLGIAKKLRDWRIEEGMKRGYSRFTAHIRTGCMPDPHHVIETYENWYDYGSFDYMEILQ